MVHKLAIALLLLLTATSFGADIFLDEPYIADYLPIDANYKLFFWLFLSRDSSSSAPLLIFINGGPGDSGESVVLNENGPFRILENGDLTKNIYSYSNHMDVMYLDQPIGTGFSTCDNAQRIPTNQLGVAKDLVAFFKQFYTKYLQYVNRTTYFTGQSFAGHYIPFVVPYLIDNVAEMKTCVKGVAVGNPAISIYSYAKNNAYANYALNHKMINSTVYDAASGEMAKCAALLKANNDTIGILTTCAGAMAIPVSGYNQYDYKTPCIGPVSCYNQTKVEKFMKRSDVLKLLKAENKTWTSTSEAVNNALLLDNIADYGTGFADMLGRGMTVLIYYGERDYICNWEGGYKWLIDLEWKGKGNIEKQGDQIITTNGEQIITKRYKGLAFMKVMGAGHFVAMDRPEVAPFILIELTASASYLKGLTLMGIIIFILLI